MERWQKSIESCDDYRIIQAPQLIEQKAQLLTKNQNEIIKLLGSPNRHQLHNRNQKIFFYQLDCTNSRELYIRFDALGRAKEIQIIYPEK